MASVSFRARDSPPLDGFHILRVQYPTDVGGPASGVLLMPVTAKPPDYDNSVFYTVFFPGVLQAVTTRYIIAEHSDQYREELRKRVFERATLSGLMHFSGRLVSLAPDAAAFYDKFLHGVKPVFDEYAICHTSESKVGWEAHHFGTFADAVLFHTERLSGSGLYWAGQHTSKKLPEDTKFPVLCMNSGPAAENGQGICE